MSEEGSRREADEEWSKLLGQTSAFLGRVQRLVGEAVPGEVPAAPEPAAPEPEELGDQVVALPRSLTSLAVSYEISGRALARARAAYGEPAGARLRVITFSAQQPEIAADLELALPGRGEREITLPRRAAFALVAVGVLDERGGFHPLAHASPLPLSPAALYPKGAIPALFINPQEPSRITAEPPPSAPKAPPLPEEYEEEPLPTSYSR